MRKILLALVLVLFLLGFTRAVMQKEDQLANGEVMILKMAPVDPRSLIQGDYMRIRFALADDIQKAWKDRIPEETKTESLSAENLPLSYDGYAVVAPDKNNVMQFVRLDNGTALLENERLLFYRLRKNGVQIAANSFFFQEGHGRAYETKAVFAELKLDKKGHPLITHLLDKEKQLIQGEVNEQEK